MQLRSARKRRNTGSNDSNPTPKETNPPPSTELERNAKSVENVDKDKEKELERNSQSRVDVDEDKETNPQPSTELERNAQSVENVDKDKEKELEHNAESGEDVDTDKSSDTRAVNKHKENQNDGQKKARGKKRKDATTRDIFDDRLKKWTGPFESPFNRLMHNDYVLRNAEEYWTKDEFYHQKCILIKAKPKFENRSTQLLLKVGEKIRNTNHVIPDGVVGTILEFKRGKVLCSNSLIFCPSKEDFTIDFYHVLKNNEWHAITPEHEIFIQHNPLLTCQLRNELHAKAVARHKESETRLNAVTAELNYNPGISLINYIPRSVEVPVIPNGQVFKYLHLDSLMDDKYPPITHQDTSDNIEPDSKRRIPCFLCSERLRWKFNVSITSNSVATMFHDGNLTHKTVINNLYKHCEENKHALFHFIAKEVFDEKGQTTFLQIQKSMKRGIFCFNDNIPLEYFELMYKGKPHLLLQAINQIMGAAIACNKQTMLSVFRMMKGFDNKGVTSKHFRSYINFCDKQLRLIGYCLGAFDYMSFFENGVTPYVLWNSMNLFFKHGMYFKTVFTPICMLEIENTLLDRNFPTTHTRYKY